MSFLADVGRSNAGQVGSGIFSDLMKYKQMERQGERDAMTTVAQAQQMDIARKGAEIQQAKELRDKAEFDAKQKEANRRLPLTLRWGPLDTWSESKKAIVAEGRAMGLVEDVGGVPTASPNDYKTFIESLDPAKAVNISAMNLSEHAADMGEIQRKLAAKPGDEKLIAERDRIVGLYTQQKEKHDELVNALAMQKKAEEGGGKPKHTYIDPTDKQPVDQLPNGSFVKGGQPFTGDLTTLVAVGAPKDAVGLDPSWLANLRKANPGMTPTQENAAIEKHQKDTAAMRGESFALTRGVSMLDTANGNAPVQMNWKEINDANKQTPGRYIPATTSVPALNKTALLEDMRGTLTNTKISLANLKTDFTPSQRMQISYVLKSGDPKSAVSSFMQGSVAGTLTTDQMEYVTDLFQLYENGMAMRSVLGAGQGSEDMRAAIRATMPGGNTPSKKYGGMQLNKIEQTLNRLQRGVPTVPLAGAKGATQTNSGPASVETRTLPNGQVWEKLSDGSFRQVK